MLCRLFSFIVLLSLVASPAFAQTIRFDTNVGTFDMELNPTGNPGLQGHVDNILAYVNSGRFDHVVVNRAAENFVMQIGGFTTDTLTLPSSFDAFPAVPSFGDLIVDEDGDEVADFDITGLTNTRGTVSLALSGPLNSGSSSFFTNLTDNTGSLDPQGFIPFARIKDMATIDLILSLPQATLADGGIASSDIPVLDINRLVVVERVFVVESPAILAASASSETSLENGGLFEDVSASAVSSSFNSSASSAISASVMLVPEPPTLVVAAGALMLIAVFSRRSIG